MVFNNARRTFDAPMTLEDPKPVSQLCVHVVLIATFSCLWLLESSNEQRSLPDPVVLHRGEDKCKQLDQ